jgi:hypothetical protein
MPILLHFFEAVRNRVGEIPWVTGEPRVQHPTLVVDGPNLTLAGYQDGAPWAFEADVHAPRSISTVGNPSRSHSSASAHARRDDRHCFTQLIACYLFENKRIITESVSFVMIIDNTHSPLILLHQQTRNRFGANDAQSGKTLEEAHK